MKHLLTLLVACFCLSEASAAVARQQSTMHYNRLLNNSPFTLKPVVEETGKVVEAPNQLEDWVLAGVLPLRDSYFVTLRHKKEAGRSEFLRGVGKPSSSGFELSKVEMGSNLNDTRVLIKVNGKTEWLNYDAKALGVAEAKPMGSPADAKKNQNGNGNRPPGVGRGGNRDRDGKRPVRAPRPRVNIPQNK